MEQINELKRRMDDLTIEITLLKGKFEDHFLTDEEKIAIDEAMEEKEEGKLVDSSEVL